MDFLLKDKRYLLKMQERIFIYPIEKHDDK